MSDSLDSHLAAYTGGFAYTLDNEIILNWYPERILELTQSRGSLLELGVGHGFSSVKFSSQFSRHVVVDGSRAIIDQFKKNYPACKSQVIESYFEKFDISEKFDAMVMGFVLEHVEDPGQILRRFKKFLVPSGRCFIAVPNAESLHRRVGKEAGLLGDCMTLGAGDLALGHRRLYTVASLKLELETAGYRLVKTEGLFLKPFTTEQIESLKLKREILRAMCVVGVEYPELSCALLAEAEPI